MLKLTDIDFKDQVVLLRTDYNVPIKNGIVTDDSRIKASLETIRYIINAGAKQIIIISHFGRPDGKVVEEMRLTPVATKLSELLGINVPKLDDCIDVKIPNEKIVLLENLRFHPEEEGNDDFFARKLVVNADIFVNDAFSVCHRAHSSVFQVPKLLPSCAGFQLIRELLNLNLENIAKPAIAVMGGAKVSTKIGLIENMLKKVDIVLIGGAMMYTFLKAMGFEVGKSKYEKDNVEIAKKLLEANKKRIVLPMDTVVADRIEEGANIKNVGVDAIKKDQIGVDIGESTVRYYNQILDSAKTVIWNGPLGIIEINSFAKGTEEIALHISELKATTIVGGGETISIIDKLQIGNKFTFVSTAGGAALEFLEGKELPGITALNDSEKKFE